MNDLEIAVKAARTGGAIIGDAFGHEIHADYKGRFDPVTTVDHASEEAIVDIITGARPDDDIVAEEAGGLESSGRYWIIDPLDATVNFIHGIPQIAVSIAHMTGQFSALIVVPPAIGFFSDGVATCEDGFMIALKQDQMPVLRQEKTPFNPVRDPPLLWSIFSDLALVAEEPHIRNYT